VRARLRATRSQAGQAFVLVAVILVTLLTGIGVAFDASFDYYNSALAERAAAAAALSGVVFMPNQYLAINAVPAGSRNDATDRAVDEAVRNGFSSSEVSAQKVLDASGGQILTELQVTITHTFPTLFMRVFGYSTLSVTQTAVAAYLPPVSIGQPGGQGGSTVSQLGAGTTNYYFMREMGFGADRSNGDPFGPDPAYEYPNGAPPPPRAALVPPSTDVHQISSQTGTDTVDATLPARGGYNYQVVLPSTGGPWNVQVYNATFGPDNAAVHNNCDNTLAGTTCSTFPTGCTMLVSPYCYYYHEEDNLTAPAAGLPFTDKTNFDAMRYTLFRVTNVFQRSSDTELSKFTVLPIDATNWAAKQYLDVKTGKTITQTYNAVTGAPTNMTTYHNWVNVATYSGANDKDASGNLLVTNQTKYATALTAGTYRLRVDSLNYDGTNPTSSCVVATGNGCGVAHKAYAVRVANASGVVCTTCTVSSWDDMDLYTPFSTTGGGAFPVPIFQLPKSYAGYTVYVDIYDPGDISGGGNVDLNILSAPTSGVTNCTGPVAAPTSPLTVTVKDLGTSLGSTTQTLLGNPATATVRATSGGSVLYNGHWIEMLIPVPSTYNPGTNTTWCLQYVTSTGVTATDTLAVSVGLQGSPEHMISG
jgi:hypothetical protein